MRSEGVTSRQTCYIGVKRLTQSVSTSDRALHLRILISRITIYSGSLVSTIRKTLSEMHNYMNSVNGNVTFNEFVRLQINALTEKGETSHYVMVNLFEGYLAAYNREFRHYIKQKKNENKEGRNTSFGIGLSD